MILILRILSAIAGVILTILTVLISITFTKGQRERFKILRKLDGKQIHLLIATAIFALMFFLIPVFENMLHTEPKLDFVQLPNGQSLIETSTYDDFRGELESAASELIDEADEYFKAGDRDFAAWRFQEAAINYQKSLNALETMSGYLRLGNSLIYFSEFEQAKEAFFSGIGIARKRKNIRFEQLFCNSIGVCFQSLGSYGIALKWFKESLTLKQRIGYGAGLAHNYHNIGTNYALLGDDSEALLWLEKSVTLAEKTGNKEILAGSYNEIGLLNKNRGDYKEALKWYKNAAMIAEDIGNQQLVAAIYNNIGVANIRLGNLQEAFFFCEEGAKINQRIGNRAGLASNYKNIADIYLSKRNLDSSFFFYQQSMTLAKDIGDVAGLANAYSGMGRYHRLKGDYAVSLEWHEKSLTIRKQIGDSTGLVANYNDIATVYFFLRNYDLSSEWYQKALYAAKKYDDKPTLALILYNLGNCANAKKQWSIALNYYMQSREINAALKQNESVVTLDKIINQIKEKMMNHSVQP